MIIGISGKMKSGKDTFARMLQFVSAKGESYEEFRKCTPSLVDRLSPWEVVKFGDKLKDIACILIGCSREQLEDQEFKETPLGEEWHVHYAEIRNRPRKIFRSRSELMKYMAHLEENHYQDYEDTHVGDYRLTPRKLLQILGTEAGREIIHPDIWINATFADYVPTKGGPVNEHIDEGTKVITYPKWIMSDPRYKNEAASIKDKGGTLLRMVRKTELRLPRVWRAYVESDFIEWDEYLRSIDAYDIVYHKSEISLDSYSGFDEYIHNNSNLESLFQQAKKIIELYGD